MDKKDINELYKRNLIELVQHHKKHCNGEGCSVNLFLLKHMAKKIGIKFTKDEMVVFL